MTDVMMMRYFSFNFIHWNFHIKLTIMKNLDDHENLIYLNMHKSNFSSYPSHHSVNSIKPAMNILHYLLKNDDDNQAYQDEDDRVTV
jgi:hypothetical protein